MSEEKVKEGPRVVVRVSAASYELIQELALERDLEINGAADQLIKVGMTRMRAVAKYGAKVERKAKPKTPKAPRVKKEKTPKTPKAKVERKPKAKAPKKAAKKRAPKKAPKEAGALTAAEATPTLPDAPAGDDFELAWIDEPSVEPDSAPADDAGSERFTDPNDTDDL